VPPLATGAPCPSGSLEPYSHAARFCFWLAAQVTAAEGGLRQPGWSSDPGGHRRHRRPAQEARPSWVRLWSMARWTSSPGRGAPAPAWRG